MRDLPLELYFPRRGQSSTFRAFISIDTDSEFLSSQRCTLTLKFGSADSEQIPSVFGFSQLLSFVKVR